MSRLRTTCDGLFALIAPPGCAECGRRPLDPAGDAPLCPACRAAIPWLPSEDRCRLCQNALDGVAHAQTTCAHCARAPSRLAACVALASFEGAVLRWLHRFKYPISGIAGLDPAPQAVVRWLARELAGRAPIPAPDRVIPIPLHPLRLQARGFNPAALLAREIGRVARVPVDFDWLRRVRHTPSQTGLSRHRRTRNVAGAFACRRSTDSPAHVWLVDDVVTTRATLEVAARTLRRAGTREVTALCIARTPEPGSGGRTADHADAPTA